MKTLTPFDDNKEYSVDEYMILTPWETLRYQYEVVGLTTVELAREFLVPIEIINDVAEEQNWIDHDKMETAEINSRTNEFYKTVRMDLTSRIATRSSRILMRLDTIEDKLMDEAENLLTHLEQLRSTADPLDLTYRPIDSLDLSRVTSVLGKLYDKHKIYEEAIIAPAQSDRKKTLDDKNVTLEELLDDIDGEGRELPGRTAGTTSIIADQDTQREDA